MGIKSKMIGQTEIKHGGDVFHDIFTQTPHHIPIMSPEKILSFTLLKGKLGTVGSVIRWDYKHDGVTKYGVEIIEEVNEEKKSIVFKVIEGDLLELYKNMTITYHVDTIGDDSLVTWTFDYEKIDVDTPHPGSLVDLFLHMVEDIEKHHQKLVPPPR